MDYCKKELKRVLIYFLHGKIRKLYDNIRINSLLLVKICVLCLIFSKSKICESHVFFTFNLLKACLVHTTFLMLYIGIDVIIYDT